MKWIPFVKFKPDYHWATTKWDYFRLHGHIWSPITCIVESIETEKNPVGAQQLKVHGGSIWRKRQGSSGLRLVQKGEKKKNTRVELMEGTTALKQSTCKTKRRNKHLEKERKKIVHVHLYTQNTNENLLTDDKDASAKVYNICSKSLHSFTNSLLFSWICQDSERISNSRLLWTSFCDEQLNQQPCDRCLVTKDSVLAGMLVLHTLLSSRVSADLNLIT